MSEASIKALPPAEFLNGLFRYEAETGILYFRERLDTLCSNFNRQFAGKVAGSVNAKGYVTLRVEHRKVLAHRVIWKMVSGDEPGIVDHINRSPGDNRWCNLRVVSHSDNLRNGSVRRSNKLGMLGIYKRCLRFIARIKIEGREVYLGSYSSLPEAIAARDAALLVSLVKGLRKETKAEP